jgi:hypothetical protein
MGILCAKKGCERKKAYGLFCVDHRVVRPLESAGPQCIAVGCRVIRPLGSMFCDRHKLARPISRDKLVVKWRSDQRRYEAKCRSTNVVGHGDSPGAAIRNWQYWWDIPF